MLKRTLLSLPLAMLAAGQAHADTDKYTIDKAHTHIMFFIDHLGYDNMVGLIKDYNGYFAFDEKNPTASSIDVTMKPASVDTNVAKLNTELAGAKFFNTAKYPTMEFKSTGVNVTGKNTADVAGNFTMMGVTKPLVLHVTYNKSGVNPITHNWDAGFSADATLKRSDFGMTTYVPMVGDDVHIHIETEGNDPLRHEGSSIKTRE